MSFEQPTWSKEVLDALHKIDWLKVIARVDLTEGPLPEKSLGVHDVLIRYKECNIWISRHFGWSLRNGARDWPSFSLRADSTDPVSRAVRKATDIVDVLWRALTIHYPRVRECGGTERSLQATLIKYVCLAYDNDWAKFLKFHTCAFFSRYELDSSGNAQELPPLFGTDQPGTLFIGKLNSICRQKGSSTKTKDHAGEFRFTILQGVKKGLPLLDEDEVYASLCSGAKDLSSIKTVPIDLLVQVERTVKEVMGEDLGTIRDYLTNNDYETISTHACIDGPRSGGGALGLAYSKLAGKRWFHFWDSDLATMRFQPRFGTWEDRIPSWRITYGHYLLRKREKVVLRLAAEADPAIIASVGPISEWTEEAQIKLLESVSAKRSDLRKIVFRGILEPLKVRPISVSRFESNHIWQPVQKRLWKSLQKFPCFQLTGTPVTSEIIEELTQNTRTVCDSIFPSMFRIVRAVSADFRAATNVLALTASLAAVESATTCPLLRAVMKNGLVGSWMHVMKDKEEIDLGVQTNGQLMGCVFSFPLLCLINAAVTRYSLERDYGRRFSLRECPMLINGDDMLCFMTPSGYDAWKRDTCAVGLEPSVGKNYYSDSFLMVNSRIFDLVDNSSNWNRPVEIKVTPRPFVNFSFITGVQKTGCTVSGDKEELSEDHCLKALSTFSQSLEFHSALPAHVQRAVELNIWERRNHLWTSLGLSTGSSGFDLKFFPDIQPDNRVDYVLARKRWGPFRAKLDLPAGRYSSGPDYCGTWRLHSSLVRTTDVWSECAFVRRALLGTTKVCKKYRALVAEVNSLSAACRSLFVAWTRFDRYVTGQVQQIMKDSPEQWGKLFESGN